MVFDPRAISYEELLRTFWEGHDPTQGMRQGNDVGHPVPLGDLLDLGGSARCSAEPRKEAYQKTLLEPQATATITTEIEPAGAFYYAEDYHQQYLAKNPAGYCGLGGTGVSCPVGLHTGG